MPSHGKVAYTAAMKPQNTTDSLLPAIRAIPRQDMVSLEDIYHQLDEDIAGRKPTCVASGRCCKFETWGHRLYVSTLELAYFERVTQSEQSAAHDTDAGTAITFPLPLYTHDKGFSPGCPWQIDGLCTARAARPLGCRIYFCDATAATWMHERYEHYHQSIMALHEQFQIPYRYMEWRYALALLHRTES